MRPRVVAAFLFSWSALVPQLLAGQPQQPPESKFADRLKPSNAWQQTAREPMPVPQDPGEQVLRDARESWADRALGFGMPLDEIYDKKLGWGRGRSYGTAHLETVPIMPHRAIVVARFTGYDFVLTKSRFALFSEMHFAVERVLEQASASIGIGSRITALLEGGTVRLPDGRVLQHDVPPRPFIPAPGRRYLLYLRYVEKGDFYLVGKSVELSGGRVFPNAPDDVRAAENGTWPFLEQDEETVLRKVADIIREQKGRN